MKEIYDLRISNDYADEVVGPNEGKKRAIVRIVKMMGTDPRLAIIERNYRELKRQGKCLFFGWDIDRQYNEQEIEHAEAFLLKITSVFEPEGEEGGTKYDDAGACPLCKAGAPQLTPLYLPERRIPKSKDISRTIAGEIVISRNLKELFVRHRISGVQLVPVRYSAKSSAESPDWFQLVLTEATVEVAPKNWIGLGLFQEDVHGEYRCRCGDTLGLNLVSEISVQRPSVKQIDVLGTRQFFGARQGVLRPERKILISPRLRLLLEAEKVKGYKVEVAHII